MIIRFPKEIKLKEIMTSERFETLNTCSVFDPEDGSTYIDTKVSEYAHNLTVGEQLAVFNVISPLISSNKYPITYQFERCRAVNVDERDDITEIDLLYVTLFRVTVLQENKPVRIRINKKWRNVSIRNTKGNPMYLRCDDIK
jgi:hypothetical protein